MTRFARVARIALAASIGLAQTGCGDGATEPSLPGFQAVSIRASGVQGTGLSIAWELDGVGSDSLDIDRDGTIGMWERLPSGSQIRMTVDSWPTDPYQLCSIQNGSVVVTDHDEVVEVACSAVPAPYTARYALSIDPPASCICMHHSSGGNRRVDLPSPLESVTVTGLGAGATIGGGVLCSAPAGSAPRVTYSVVVRDEGGAAIYEDSVTISPTRGTLATLADHALDGS